MPVPIQSGCINSSNGINGRELKAEGPTDKVTQTEPRKASAQDEKRLKKIVNGNLGPNGGCYEKPIFKPLRPTQTLIDPDTGEEFAPIDIEALMNDAIFPDELRRLDPPRQRPPTKD